MYCKTCLRLSVWLFLIAPLSACGYLSRDDTAAAAKTHMIGMSKEDVLACMGPAKKKATEGATDVWQYHSTDGQSTTDWNTLKPKRSAYGFSRGSFSKNYCTVNIVMKDGFVKAVNYLGPSGTLLFTEQDQCGYAVAACVAR